MHNLIELIFFQTNTIELAYFDKDGYAIPSCIDSLICTFICAFSIDDSYLAF